AGLELGPGLVGAIVEHNRRPHAETAVAVDRGNVRTGDTVVGEMFVERLDAHRPHPLCHEVADRIVDHCSGNAGLQVETVGEVGGDVELAATDVDRAAGRL